MQNFFISCPMGQEKTTWDEITLKWKLFLNSDVPVPTFSLGGIEIECSVMDGLAINLFSKTANKVLLRLKSQKCRDIPKLFNLISKIDWKSFLKTEQVYWNISSHQSRLFNTKKIENACRDGLVKYFNANQLSKKIKDRKEDYHTQNIFLRFDHDLLTVSIDTSGELLHIRGDESYRGHASLRSTIASCLLWELLKNENDYTLLDPMCGTGTFLKEALNFFHISKRNFPFEDWSEYPKLNAIDSRLGFIKLIGLDRDQQVIKKNKQTQSAIQYIQKDLFDPSTQDKKENDKVIVICNPPYGKRIKLDRPRDMYFQNLIDKILEQYSPYKIGILLPLDILLKQKTKKYRIFNGGIWLNFHIIKFYRTD